MQRDESRCKIVAPNIMQSVEWIPFPQLSNQTDLDSSDNFLSDLEPNGIIVGILKH